MEWWCMDLKILLGNNIRYYRIKNFFTQEQLAEMVNVSVNYISRMERGLHNSPLNMINKFAIVFNILPYELFLYNDFNKLPKRVNLKK